MKLSSQSRLRTLEGTEQAKPIQVFTSHNQLHIPPSIVPQFGGVSDPFDANQSTYIIHLASAQIPCDNSADEEYPTARTSFHSSSESIDLSEFNPLQSHSPPSPLYPFEGPTSTSEERLEGRSDGKTNRSFNERKETRPEEKQHHTLVPDKYPSIGQRNGADKTKEANQAEERAIYPTCPISYSPFSASNTIRDQIPWSNLTVLPPRPCLLNG